MDGDVVAEKDGLKAIIVQDDSPESPREWNNEGKMVCFHRRYDLGDKHDIRLDEFDDWEGLAKILRTRFKARTILPLYLYDHSGISISCGNSYPFNDRWDAGCIGFIYSTHRGKKAKEGLLAEVKIYNQYLNSDFYGYRIEDSDGTVLASCYGYYGTEAVTEAAKEALESQTPLAVANSRFDRLEAACKKQAEELAGVKALLEKVR